MIEDHKTSVSRGNEHARSHYWLVTPAAIHIPSFPVRKPFREMSFDEARAALFHEIFPPQES